MTDSAMELARSDWCCSDRRSLNRGGFESEGPGKRFRACEKRLELDVKATPNKGRVLRGKAGSLGVPTDDGKRHGLARAIGVAAQGEA